MNQPIEAVSCSTAETQNRTSVSNTAGSVGLPSVMVAEGGQTHRSKAANESDFARIGSDYDAETADLVRELLATGYTTAALCVALTVDDDTLRRWRRGVRASHMARKFMRAVLLLRVIAPGPLVCLSTYSPAELRQAAELLSVRHLTPDDVRREARTAEEKRMGWCDGAEGGGL